MDPLRFIIAAEEAPELMTVDEYIEGMAGLIRTGIINGLQGSWQRSAARLIEQGVVDLEGNIDRDALDALMELAYS